MGSVAAIVRLVHRWLRIRRLAKAQLINVGIISAQLYFTVSRVESGQGNANSV